MENVEKKCCIVRHIRGYEWIEQHLQITSLSEIRRLGPEWSITIDEVLDTDPRWKGEGHQFHFEGYLIDV